MDASDVVTVVAFVLCCLATTLTARSHRREAERERRYAEASQAEWRSCQLTKLVSADRQIAQQWEREYQVVTGEPYPGA